MRAPIDYTIEDIFDGTARLTAEQINDLSVHLTHIVNKSDVEGTMTCVAPGGKFGHVHGKLVHLGLGIARPYKRRSLSAVLYDFTFGYISGFPVRWIFYYLRTRTFNFRRDTKYRGVPVYDRPVENFRYKIKDKETTSGHRHP